MTLIEKYQPKALDQIIGQSKAIRMIERIIGRPDFTGDSFYIVGPSGTGKTSTARALAHRLASPAFVYELDGEACTVDAVREASDQMRYRAMDGRFKVWIVNEAQAMTAKAVQAWLTALDPLPQSVVVIFTTTEDSPDLFGQYSSAFTSRCKLIEFTNQGLADSFAERAREIAQAECLDGQPLEKYKRLVQAKRNNFRAVIQAIESGAMELDDARQS